MMKNLEKNWEPDPNIVNEIEIHLKNKKDCQDRKLYSDIEIKEVLDEIGKCTTTGIIMYESYLFVSGLNKLFEELPEEGYTLTP